MNPYQILEQYLEYCSFIKGCTKATRKRYKNQIRFFLDSVQISSLEEIDEYKAYQFLISGRTQRNWKATSYLTYLVTLNTFFTWCLKRRIVNQNPFQEIEKPILPKSLPKKLSAQESQNLLDYAYHMPSQSTFIRTRNHAIIATFLFCGLRRTELLNLKLHDVDVENRTLFVNQGKGRKDRMIPISSTLAYSLERYLAERQKLNPATIYFFTSCNLERPLGESGLRYFFRRVKVHSGIKFGTHQLRHTFATLMLEGGCDIYSLSKMLGHSDIKTTTIYLSATPEHLRSQVLKHPLN